MTSRALVIARAVALYLLSVVASAGVAVSWLGGNVAPWVVGLTGAMLVGLLMAPSGADPGSVQQLRRPEMYVRLLAATGYALLLLTLVQELSDRPSVSEIERAAFLLLIVQVAAVALRGVIERGPVVNAMALVALIGLRGGPIAAVFGGITVLMLVAFLAVDYPVRVRALYPAAPEPPVGSVVRAGLRLGALPFVILAIAAAPWWPTQGPPVSRGQAPQQAVPQPVHLPLYQWIVIGLALAVGVVLIILIIARSKRRAPAPAQEAADVTRTAEEVLVAPPRPRPVAYEGTRGRIVRSYVGVLREAERQGLGRKNGETPGAFAATSAMRSASLNALTLLFERARYGPVEPAGNDAATAEQEARAAADHVHHIRARAADRIER